MSKKNKPASNWIPEILYEENSDGISSHVPFIQVPEGEEMPKFIFIFESRETGEFEPGSDGEEVPVTELDLHQYADMAVLKAGLSTEIFDKVRDALGLEPVKTAAEKGKQISQNIRNKIGN